MRNGSRSAHLMRIPPNFFSIPFGISGLAVMWRVMTRVHGAPAAIADALFLTAALVWLVLMGAMLERVVREPYSVLRQLRDPALSPFWALPPIVGMLLAVDLQPHAPADAKVVFVVFLGVTILSAGWITGLWIADDLDQSLLHPGYFLPTVAGGLLGAQGAAGLGLRDVGWLGFGLGMVSWFMLGSMILNRLMFVKRLPATLVPTLAIELAPPAVAGSAYLALHGSRPDALLYGLTGFAGLMVLVQVRLVPLYRRLRFTPGFWAFTFSWTAVASFALRWLEIERPAGEHLYARLIGGAATVLVAMVAIRSALAIVRGEFLPASTARSGVAGVQTGTSTAA